MAAFPATAQEALDRLLTDRAFLIQTVVNDNFTAVRSRFLASLQDQPARVNTPEKLVKELLWWDKNDPEGVDDVLEVSWQNSLGSKVLNDAFVELQNRASTTGTGGTKILGSIITAVNSLLGSGAAAQAQADAAARAAAEAAAREAERKAQQDRFIRIAVSAFVVLAVVALIIYIRRK